MKQKVIMFSDSFFPVTGGRETVIYNLMKNIQKFTPAELVSATFNGKPEFIKDNKLGFIVTRFPSIRVTKNEYLVKTPKKIKNKIEEDIKNSNVGLLHTHTKFSLANYAIKLSKTYNLPIITTCHTNYIMQYKNQLKCPIIYKPLLRYVVKTINKMDEVVTVSNFMRNQLKSIGVTKPITVIPNGTDLINVTPSESELTLVKEKYNLTNTANIFIYVGRLSETKNLSFLLKSISLVKSKLPNFKLVLVGVGNKNKYIKLAKKLNILDNLVFTGNINNRIELASLYNISKLNLFPSVGDSFGLTIIESATQNTPSVVIKNTAPSERIINFINGFVSKLTIEDYSKTILDATASEIILSRISENAKQLLPISWSDVAKEYFNLYEKLKASTK